ncbi:hypothetical protein GXW82_27345 [Streptacidiphilus sp. 4-A2]|nr:hypothetical protein [Streptacidiphilus sp. 4-A2]
MAETELLGTVLQPIVRRLYPRPATTAPGAPALQPPVTAPAAPPVLPAAPATPAASATPVPAAGPGSQPLSAPAASSGQIGQTGQTGVRLGRVHGVGANRHRQHDPAPSRTGDNLLAGRYAQRLLEVLSGHRVCDQLTALVTEEVHADIRTLVRRRCLIGPNGTQPVLWKVFDDSPRRACWR